MLVGSGRVEVEPEVIPWVGVTFLSAKNHEVAPVAVIEDLGA